MPLLRNFLFVDKSCLSLDVLSPSVLLFFSTDCRPGREFNINCSICPDEDSLCWWSICGTFLVRFSSIKLHTHKSKKFVSFITGQCTAWPWSIDHLGWCINTRSNSTFCFISHITFNRRQSIVFSLVMEALKNAATAVGDKIQVLSRSCRRILSHSFVDF